MCMCGRQRENVDPNGREGHGTESDRFCEGGWNRMRTCCIEDVCVVQTFACSNVWIWSDCLCYVCYVNESICFRERETESEI